MALSCAANIIIIIIGYLYKLITLKREEKWLG